MGSCICHHDCKGTLIGFFYVRRNDPYFGHGRYGGSHEVRVIFLDGSRLCYGGTHLCGVMHCWVRYTCPHSAAHRLCCLECSQGSGTCAEHHYARCVDPDCLRSGYFSAAWIFPNLSQVSIIKYEKCRNDLRIFLPRTTCPCSDWRARRQAPASKN